MLLHEAQVTYSSVLIECIALMYIDAPWFCCNMCLSLMVKKSDIVTEGEEGYHSITGSVEGI